MAVLLNFCRVALVGDKYILNRRAPINYINERGRP